MYPSHVVIPPFLYTNPLGGRRFGSSSPSMDGVVHVINSNDVRRMEHPLHWHYRLNQNVLPATGTGPNSCYNNNLGSAASLRNSWSENWSCSRRTTSRSQSQRSGQGSSQSSPNLRTTLGDGGDSSDSGTSSRSQTPSRTSSLDNQDYPVSKAGAPPEKPKSGKGSRNNNNNNNNQHQNNNNNYNNNNNNNNNNSSNNNNNVRWSGLGGLGVGGGGGGGGSGGYGGCVVRPPPGFEGKEPPLPSGGGAGGGGAGGSAPRSARRFHYNRLGGGGYRGRRLNMLYHFSPPFPPGFVCTPYCTAPDRFLSRAHLMEVRDTPGQLAPQDPLSQAVWAKFLANQQTETLYRKKMMLWKYLFVCIKSQYPKYGLYLVGSTMSGFASNTSDVDMCLLVRSTDIDQRNVAVSYLGDILKILQCCDCVEKPEIIQAKVPILKFRDSSQGLEVDLNCNNAVGIRNTHLLYCYSQMDWRVRPLVVVIKLWAHRHDINDAKNMTISSYSLALMVIHFLQCGPKPAVLPCLHSLYRGKFSAHSDINTIDVHEDLDPYLSDNNQPLGELLLQFFQYYSKFKYSKYAISVRCASVIPIEECRQVRTVKNDPHQWKLLCIEEPFDLTNTARSVYDPEVFNRICKLITRSAQVLEETGSLESIFQFDPLT